MKNQSNFEGMTMIPTATLNCLKKMMFGKDGVDLTNIINDIATGMEYDPDMVAINVALAFKGITPDIDKSARFQYEWRGMYQHEFVGYSLIQNIVKVKTKSFSYNKDTKEFVYNNETLGLMGLEEWYRLDTNPEQVKKRVVESMSK